MSLSILFIRADTVNPKGENQGYLIRPTPLIRLI